MFGKSREFKTSTGWLEKFKHGMASGTSAFKVAEHSFQEPMPNSPLLFSHLCFGARFLQE